MKNDKKVLILSAVLSLIEKGCKKENIKVSDIAKEAGIGKGTVYEYFSSREEIIGEAIMLSCSMTLKNAEAIADGNMCFKEKIYSLLTLISKKISSISVFLDVLFEQGDIHSLIDRIKSSSPENEDFVKNSIMKILNQGKEEHILSYDKDDEAVYMFQHIISGFMVMIYNKKLKNGDIDDNSFELTFKLLVKALN